MAFVRPALISVTAPGGSAKSLSDHNRSPLDISYEPIEKSQRTANGTMRKYVVATKRTFTTSWQDLPGMTSQTVDAKMGAMELKKFYEDNFDNSFVFKIYAGSESSPTQRAAATPTETVNTSVFISNFSCTISKRLGGIDFWNVDISFVEV